MEAIRKAVPVALSAEYMMQLTDDGGRKYLRGDTEYTSVTSLISSTLHNFGIPKWRAEWIAFQLEKFNGRKLTRILSNDIVTAADKEMEKSASIGTHMHNIIECLLKDEDVNDVPDQLEPAVQAWLKWRRRHIEWELIATEVGVYGTYEGVNYAGQVDALFRLNNQYMVVDWKTSSGLYESSFLQVAGYAHALKGMYGMTPTVKAMVVRLVNDYPRTEDGKKDRTKEKIFNGKVQFAEVDVPHWSAVFDHIVAVHGGKKYVRRTTI